MHLNYNNVKFLNHICHHFSKNTLSIYSKFLHKMSIHIYLVIGDAFKKRKESQQIRYTKAQKEKNI